MKLHIIDILSVIFLMLILPEILPAQLKVTAADIAELFDKDAKATMSTFAGLLANAHPMDMVIGVAGKEVKGILSFRGDELLYQLEGFEEGNSLRMMVIDEFEERCGKLDLKLVSNSLIGTWWNLDESMKYEVNLNRGDQVIEDDEVWLRKFSLVNDGHYESMILERFAHDQIYASYFSNKVGQVIEDQVKCLSQDCSQFDLVFGDQVKIKASLTSSKKLNANYELASGNLFKRYDFETELNYHPFREISYSYRIDGLFPKINNTKLNDELQARITNIINNFKEQILATEKGDGWNPGLNLKYELLAWTEVTCITNTLLSGMVIFINNLDYQSKTLFFNYNLQDNKSFEIVDFLKPDLFENEDFRSFIYEEVNSQLDEQMSADQEWMDNINIRPNYFNDAGIVFSSNYHQDYGILEVVVPYPYLSQIGLKRNNPFQKLITLTKT